MLESCWTDRNVLYNPELMDLYGVKYNRLLHKGKGKSVRFYSLLLLLSSAHLILGVHNYTAYD